MNNFFKILIVVFLFGIISTAFGFWGEKECDIFCNADKKDKDIVLVDDGLSFNIETQAGTVGEFLDEHDIKLGDKDLIFPNESENIYQGDKVIIKRSKDVVIVDGESEVETDTFLSLAGDVISESGIKLSEFDIVEPSKIAMVYDGLEIVITRVEIVEEVEEETIKFKEVAEEDDDMGWREEKIIQEGEKGIKEVKYEVVYHNGEEISRKIKDSEVVKEPVEQITKRGAYVKMGKAHTGLCTWYGQPSHLKSAYPSITGFYAANPWLPKGSYVKVTNKANGKSIIARINDRGPFGDNRILDLSKEAFSAIASLGAGVVDIKMEEILN